MTEGGYLVADGFEPALLGIATQFSGPPIAVYDYRKCVEVLVSRDGLTWEEAEEHMSFNVTGAWVGPQTPMFLLSQEDYESSLP